MVHSKIIFDLLQYSCVHIYVYVYEAAIFCSSFTITAMMVQTRLQSRITRACLGRPASLLQTWPWKSGNSGI